MEKAVEVFKQHHGYARMKDLKIASIQSRDVAKLLNEGKIEKIKSGLYKLSGLRHEQNVPVGFIDVCKAVPKGVICLLSALDYHELTTYIPSEIHAAIPHNMTRPHIGFPPIKIYYFRDRFYNLGIEEILTASGPIRIYGMEKTVCDMFRYRYKLGEDIALEGLKNYLGRKNADIHKLTEYASRCHVKAVLLPYAKALVAS